MAQTKEQIKTPENQLGKMEIGNLSDAEFKTLVIKMLKKLSENLNSIKIDPVTMKDTLIEIKNNLQGNNTRVNEAKNQINDLEHKEAKNNHTETQEKTIKKNKDSSTASGTISRGPMLSS